jgi:hypothetical protein
MYCFNDSSHKLSVALADTDVEEQDFTAIGFTDAALELTTPGNWAMELRRAELHLCRSAV